MIINDNAHETGTDLLVKMADAGAVGIAGATLIGWLPAIAAILTIGWTVIRIYETETFQSLLRKLGRK